MRKRYLKSLAFILLVIASVNVNCVQIDNELVSKPHSCFERIAIGAMLPFVPTTFRRSDTNQLDVCTNLCLTDPKCMTFAFGISARGNGTCQLSSQVIDGTGSSPAGTIFDPDFDLYAKKTSNCLVDPGPNNGAQFPRPGGFDQQQQPGNGNGYSGSTNLPPARPTQSSFPPTDGNRPNPTTVFISSSVSPTAGTYPTDISDTTSGDFSGSTFSSEDSPTHSDSLYNINNVNFPTTYPTTHRNIPQNNGNQHEISIKPTTDPIRPNHNNHRPVVQSHFNSDRPDVHHAYPIGPDPFPDYFPQPHPPYHYNLDHYDDKHDNSHFPGIYAQNAPSLHHPDRYFTHTDHFGLYPAGRYPDSGINLPNYNPNRKNGYQVTENNKDTAPMPMRPKTCFRRVLAGKRIAPHWVRRTLICERLEDCQQQCSEERRFSCEGFNYRLDPSGRGQGECELVDVPLSQMDLYSSPHNRDMNLIPHPDYDYYERDRTTSNCRPNCIDCISNSNSNYLPSSNNRPPSSGYKPEIHKPSYEGDRYRPDNTAIDKYRPQNHFYETRPMPVPDSWDRYGHSNFYGSSNEHGFRPQPFPESRPPYVGSIDRYGTEESDRPDRPDRPDYRPDFRPDYRPGPPYRPNGFIDTSDYNYQPPAVIPAQQPSKPYDRPSQPSVPYDRPQQQPPPRPIPTDNNYNRPLSPPQQIPQKPDYDRPDPPYSPSKPDSTSQQSGSYGGSSSSSSSGSSSHHQSQPPRPGLGFHHHEREPPNYHPTNFHQKPSAGFVPYLIGQHENAWGMYGGTYGSSSISYRPQVDYWGLKNEIKRIDGPPNFNFNYYELGPHEENSVYNRYGSSIPQPPPSYHHSGPMNFGSMWTRRPGMEECSVKTSEGFRLDKGVVRNAMTTASLRECEKMCYSEDKFRCSVYSYRYSEPMRDNCLLCDRSFSLLDSYADIVPDRNYDIYAMSDDLTICKKEQQPSSSNYGGSNDQCFIRTIDHKRFFKAIVRDSLTVRSIKDCEIECIKAQKFTCRSFTFRYGSKTSGTIIDNCQLSDWPVRDMDHDRHLIPDDGFDVFERASYGRGCEIVPHEHNHQNPKLCYLGYGSAAKLLSSAIKKIISVSSELECKNECIRYRETSPFKCLSFSYGSQASTFNCEMSDLDQSELKMDVHYTHTPNRDFWLFAWNPWDYTCRDKITSISGNRVNSDRRLDIFREPGKLFNRTSVISSSQTASSPISQNISNNSQVQLTESSSSNNAQ